MSPAEYENFLEDISECFITGLFDKWYSRMTLPFSMVTARGTVTLETVMQAEANFEWYVSACQVMKLTDIIRVPGTLSRVADGTWHGTYETNLLSNGMRMAEPYSSTAVLSVSNNVWKMSAILNARGHSDWTGKTPEEEIRTYEQSAKK